MPRTGWARRSRRTATIRIFTSSLTISAGRDAFFARPISKAPVWKLSLSISFPAKQQPVRVVAFNTSEGWSQVSAEIAQEMRRRCDLNARRAFLPSGFVDQYEGLYHDVQLPLPMRLV